MSNNDTIENASTPNGEEHSNSSAQPNPISMHSETGLTMRDLFLQNYAVNNNLYYDGKRLPYNPDLAQYARELRKRATLEERRIWKYLRTLPLHAYRQRIIDNYIVDFCIPSKHYVIEIDGGQHYSLPAKQYDARRTLALNTLGLTVTRFSNSDVKQNFDLVCMHIWRELEL